MLGVTLAVASATVGLIAAIGLCIWDQGSVSAFEDVLRASKCVQIFGGWLTNLRILEVTGLPLSAVWARFQGLGMSRVCS